MTREPQRSDTGFGILDADARLRLSQIRSTFDRDLRERRLAHEARDLDTTPGQATAQGPAVTTREPSTPCPDGQQVTRPA